MAAQIHEEALCFNRPPWLSQARDILSMVSEETGISEEVILGDARTAPISKARRKVYLGLWLRGASYAKIGRLLQRDHTTVIHGIRLAIAEAEHA